MPKHFFMEKPDINEVHLNVLLLGRPQSGKSATGNILLGSYEFESRLSLGSVTQSCELCQRRFSSFVRRDGREATLCVNVLDTPAFPHSYLKASEVKNDIHEALLEKFQRGLDAVVLVLRADVAFSEEDFKCIQLAEELLDFEWRNYFYIIFTHHDRFEENGLKLEEQLSNAPKALKFLLESAKNRYHFVNSVAPWLHAEGRPVLEKLLSLSQQNKYKALEFKQSAPSLQHTG
ncbi:GTPase IMAP family member GIMD1-like [Polypterus senegalus]|uniref:GTPase IMAP family member GIMD1-like n=1 Tax=Polypterus senegalus TaxID=55291 RepID=UPI001964C491|nr:GTPase IMAP family member GIMD1-like [Polypterus senegalus]